MYNLKLSEKIILYLGDHAPEVSEGYRVEFPYELTQAGIAENIGMSLERISTTLRELENSKLVRRVREFSRTTGRFKNFYFLTKEGLSACHNIRERLGQEIVRVRDLNDELKEMQISDLMTYLRYILKSDENRGSHELKGGETFSQYFLRKLGRFETYALKEVPPVQISYTNILKNVSQGIVDFRAILEPKSVDINKRMWFMIRDAYYDSSSKCVVLTKNRGWQAGVVWLKKGIKSPFTVDFRYRAGGGTGGDGFVLMFYKNKRYWPCDGGNLGFGPGLAPATGYGVEFDSLPNADYNDPPYPHIALIKDHAKNHLEYVEDARVSDFKWHVAKIVVDDSSVTVYVDDDKVLEWSGKIDRTRDGIGFAASTGGLDNWHMVEDIKIIKAIVHEKFMVTEGREIKSVQETTNGG